MKLITFQTGTECRIGVLATDEITIVDLSIASPSLPRDMTAFVELGDDGLKQAEAAVESAASEAKTRLDAVTLLSPFPVPKRNLLCVGKNYYEHAEEFHNSGFDATAGGTAVPEFPIIFTKATTSVTGPDTVIPASADPTNSTDYEGELGVVIGLAGKGIVKANAYDHVYGYTIINDVTARDLQSLHKQWFIGKSPDGFCPMGPVLVTADEIGDVTDLHLSTFVNGEKRQEAQVSDLIFDIPTIIETLSATMTLVPGDIIATGTPAGVGIGFDPPVYLKSGDQVTVIITKIGELRNSVE